jgi:hypothetical protein
MFQCDTIYYHAIYHHQAAFSLTGLAHSGPSLGLVRLRRIASGIVPANHSLYKLEKQSG